SAYRVGERSLPQVVRCQPLASVPGANEIPRLRFLDRKRQQRLRAERLLDLLVGHQLRRAAELAALTDTFGIEDRNRLTALTLDRDLVGLPAAARVRDVAERRDQVVLDDDGVGAARLERRRRLGAAKR